MNKKREIHRGIGCKTQKIGTDPKIKLCTNSHQTEGESKYDFFHCNQKCVEDKYMSFSAPCMTGFGGSYCNFGNIHCGCFLLDLWDGC